MIDRLPFNVINYPPFASGRNLGHFHGCQSTSISRAPCRLGRGLYATALEKRCEVYGEGKRVDRGPWRLTGMASAKRSCEATLSVALVTYEITGSNYMACHVTNLDHHEMDMCKFTRSKTCCNTAFTWLKHAHPVKALIDSMPILSTKPVSLLHVLINRRLAIIGVFF